MNRERIGKLLTAQDSGANQGRLSGHKLLKRPDGGEVTQRTANPRPTRRNPRLLAIFAFRSRRYVSSAYAASANR